MNHEMNCHIRHNVSCRRQHPLLLVVALLAFCSICRVQAQTLALRTNALFWGVEAANLSADFTVNECSTIGITGIYSLQNSWLREANVRGAELEYRYWFSHQPFHRLFMGPMVGIFHYSYDDYPARQLAVPVGLNAGYAWTLTDHWNLEACYGLGCLFYNRTDRSTDTTTRYHKFTSINLGLSLSYVF